MASDRFGLALTARLLVLFATLAALAHVVVATSLVMVGIVIAVAAVVQGALVIRAVHRTNRELARLVGALRYDDYQQSFGAALGGSFAELARALDAVVRRFRDARFDREAQLHYLEALVEHVPVAIVVVRGDGDAIELVNGAARRLFNAPAAVPVRALADHGASFARDVAQRRPGERTVTRMEIDGVQRHLVMSTTQLVVGGAAVSLVALQDIQRELDGNELAAWQDMARILSHEIMNSLTPIASLARTADELVDQLARTGPGDELVADLHAAIQTVARRSDGLMRFVKSYRAVMQMPPPTLRPIALGAYFARIEKLLAPEWAARGVALHVAAPAGGLAVDADESLLDQAVINLLRNAADAAAARPGPAVWLEARLSDRGRPVIEIGDNGPGVDAELGDKIFLPFFTTKPEGSGIGLALARQVMLVHKGAITATARPGGGALFRLTF